MLFGLCDVIDLMVFNKEGKLLVELNSLKENDLNFEKGDNYLSVKDALLNTKMLEMMGNAEQPTSDYEKELISSNKTISFGSKGDIECKLIGKGLIKDATTGQTKIFKFEIPNAKLKNKLQIMNSCARIS